MAIRRTASVVIARTIVTCSIACAVVGTACSRDKPAHGQLVVALDSDMTLPDQIDTIELVVSVEGEPIFDTPLLVGTGLDRQPIPATLTLVSGPDPSLPATIQVIGKKDGVARTFRQVVTTVPSGRVGMLRMPVQWLCDGMVQEGPGGDGGSQYQSTCPEGSTCKAGECVPSQTMSSSLDDYSPQLVFGGGGAPSGTMQTAGTCYDTVQCMASGSIVVPDDQCTVDLPAAGPSVVNVGLSVPGYGICSADGTSCFVPLDQDKDDGWSIQDGRVALPPAVCDKLRNGQIEAVEISTACASKTPAVPTCGPWSSVAPAADATVGPIGDAATPPPPPSLLATVAADGGAITVCCPLIADSTHLYTCLCPNAGSPSATTRVQLVAIDPSSGAVSPSGAFSPSPPAMNRPRRTSFPSVLADGNVWWVDRTLQDAAGACSIFGTSPATGTTGSPLAVVDGDIYDGADILADQANLYLLGDAFTNLGLSPTSSPVQLLKVSRATGAVVPLDTGGNGPSLQLTQDATSVYLAIDNDTAVASSDSGASDAGVYQRVSSIMRFPKAGTSPSIVVQDSTFDTADLRYGGFVGVQDDGTTLFTLWQSHPSPDGTLDVQVLKLDPDAMQKTTVFEAKGVDPGRIAFRMLGAVNGAVVLAKDVTVVTDGGTTSQSSVVVVPPGGPERVVASFVGDSPAFELIAPPLSPDAFWVNASGRVFRLPAGALR